MTNFGITSDQASTLFGSLNSSLNSTNTTMYNVVSASTTYKIQAKYYAKGFESDTYSIDKKFETAEKAEIKQEGLDLKSPLASLIANSKESAFNQYEGIADDKDVIKSATLKNASGVQAKAIDINVKQLAKTQQNIGNQVDSKEKALEAGNYSFKIDVEGKTHTINYKVESGDTNVSVQKKIAAALNDKNIGVTAKVNTVDDKSYLSIESNKTGKTAGGSDTLFKISSTGSVSQSAIDKFGLDNVTQKAQNAVYSVNNGADTESRSNQVKLSNGAEVEFGKVSDGNVKVKFEADRNVINNSVKNFISEFNDTLNGSYSDKVSKALATLSKSHKSSLAKIGLEVNSKGEISINEEKFNKATVSQIKDVFNGSYSFGGSVNRKASEMVSNPQKFLDNSKSLSGLYDNSGSIYSQFGGNMFDYLF